MVTSGLETQIRPVGTLCDLRGRSAAVDRSMNRMRPRPTLRSRSLAGVATCSTMGA